MTAITWPATFAAVAELPGRSEGGIPSGWNCVGDGILVLGVVAVVAATIVLGKAGVDGERGDHASARRRRSRADMKEKQLRARHALRVRPRWRHSERVARIAAGRSDVGRQNREVGSTGAGHELAVSDRACTVA